MKNFFFTFGQSHRTVEGYPLKDYWVRAVAPSYEHARDIFNDWCIENMGDADKWAFQYTEEDFHPEYYEGGEYAVLDKVE